MALPDLRASIVRFFEGEQKLLETEALERIVADRQPLVLSQRIVALFGRGPGLVTREMAEQAAAIGHPGHEPRAATFALNAPRPEAPFLLLKEGFHAPVADRDPLAAYTALFESRYRALSRMLKGRAGLANLRPIAQLRSSDREASIIGLVRELKETAKKDATVLTLEDESGETAVWVPHTALPNRETFVPDEVVGLHLHLAHDGQKLHRAEAVYRPDVPNAEPQVRADRPPHALFLSDLHIGSRSFLAEAWGRLIDFLHGRGPLAELAPPIGHVVIAGDLVDGIGVYKDQERELAIPDVTEQYAELGRRLKELPSRLNVVVVPGNHDAVPLAEPQPALPPSRTAALPANVRSLSNPATFALNGATVLAYHGRGLDSLIPALPGASYARPTEVMRRMLRMRHLAPIYGDRTPLAPSPHDGLVIDPVPDILVTGHAHTYGIGSYRGVLLINASTWQGETPYQRARNITPVPARAALVDLADRTARTLDFSRPEPRQGGADG